MKSIIASGLLLGMAHGAAIAGPYVNIENNAGFTGSDFSGHVTDFHVGYEGSEGAASYYIQGGPSLSVPDAGKSDTILTGKVGGSVSVSSKLDVYGELSAAFDDVNSYGTKAGVKYKF
jgi:hypothetical protein